MSIDMSANCPNMSIVNREDVKLTTSVHMPGMRGIQVVVQINPYRRIRAKVIDLPLIWERKISLRNLVRNGQVVVAMEGAVIQFPREVAGRVLDEVDVDVYHC